MRVIFAGLLQTNVASFRDVVQELPGCTCVICPDLTRAWDVCLETEPDLLLVDTATSSCLELIKKIRAHYADIPVLMLIGQADKSLRLQALKAGVSDFLSSPLDELECQVRIGNLLALRKSRQDLIKRTAWLADEVNEAYQAMELNATQAQEISEMGEANLKLEQANRNKNDTLARVSHDLRAPLATILGYSELLSTDEPQVSRTREVIRRNAHHLLTLIDELLEFARTTIGHSQNKPEAICLQALLDDLMQQVQVGASGNCVALDLFGNLPQVIVIDVLAVKRVLSNLLSNATKFTVNGMVILRVSATGDDLKLQTLLFEVVDSGAGIAPEELEYIFEPFYRVAHTAVPGTGLGLAICRQLAEAMGGRISVESSPGKGSCFSLCLTCPVEYLAESGYRTEASVATELGSIVGAGRLVLLVEDAEEVRHYLTVKLSRAGYRVISAENGRAALDVLAKNHEIPAFVITDQMMPEMDGWALLSALRIQYGVKLPVVLFSSGAPKPPLSWDERIGFDAVLLKSADSGVLLNALAQILKLEEFAPQTDNDEVWDIEAPDQARLEQFQFWAEQGALSILEAEALKLAENSPQYADFSRFVTTRCGMLDIEGVAHYCKAQLLCAAKL
jgi:signal transduction histidine kinase